MRKWVELVSYLIVRIEIFFERMLLFVPPVILFFFRNYPCV